MKKKKIILLLLVISLVIITGCGSKKSDENVSNKDNTNSSEKSDYQENNIFILKDHKGYYNDTKDKYIIEGTIVNKTDETFENKVIMIRVLDEKGNIMNFASCKIEKIGPKEEVKIVADTPTLDKNAKEIKNYQLK